MGVRTIFPDPLDPRMINDQTYSKLNSKDIALIGQINEMGIVAQRCLTTSQAVTS